ncbi:MAG: radical SAM protein [Planctomycetaceae bacterium]|nr:radical SAM protein [Planctomycetaceae bacterium]
MPFHTITYSDQYRRATVHNWGCNFRCRGCTYKLKQNPRPERFLSVDAIRDCLRTLDLDAVHFMGGEPTTNPQLPELLAFCKRGLGVITRLGHTNGSGLITEDLDAANVSFKAVDDYLHREYTGCSVLPSLDNFCRVYDAGLAMKASTVFIPDFGGLEQVRKVAAFVGGIDRGIPFHVLGYIPVPDAPWRRPTDDEMARAVATARQYVGTVTFSHFTTEQAKDLSQRDERFAVRQVL